MQANSFPSGRKAVPDKLKGHEVAVFELAKMALFKLPLMLSGFDNKIRCHGHIS